MKLWQKITADNWAQRGFQTYDGRLCLLAHLRVKHGGDPYNCNYTDDFAKDYTALRSSLNEDIIRWNDSSIRTVEQVIEVCKALDI